MIRLMMKNIVAWLKKYRWYLLILLLLGIFGYAKSNWYFINQSPSSVIVESLTIANNQQTADVESKEAKLLSYTKLPIFFSADTLKTNLESGTYGVCPHELFDSESDIAPSVPIPIKDFCIGSHTEYFPGNMGYVNQLVGHGFHLERSIKSGVNAYQFTYTSEGVMHEIRRLSASVFVPEKSVKIKGIILYFHGSEIAKNNIPSCFALESSTLPDYCHNKINDKYITELGGVFTSQGYIVVAPDYIGYGLDNHIVHPYIFYPQVNVISGLDALISARNLLGKLNIVDSKKSMRLYVTGYSEGGAYALWASKLFQTSLASSLESSHLKLIMTTVAEGAYDLVNVQMPFELSDLKDGVLYGNSDSDNVYKIVSSLEASLAKPLIMSLGLVSYGYYTNIQDYSKLLNRDFYEMNCGSDCAISGLGRLNLLQIYGGDADALSALNIMKAIRASVLSLGSGQHKYDPLVESKKIRFNVFGIVPLLLKLKNQHFGYNNHAKIMINSDIMKDKDFKQKLLDSSILGFKTNSKLDLVTLAYDSVVPSKNTENAYNQIYQQSPRLVIMTQLQNYPLKNNMIKTLINNKMWTYQPSLMPFPLPIDHPNATIFALFVALRDFNANK